MCLCVEHEQLLVDFLMRWHALASVAATRWNASIVHVAHTHTRTHACTQLGLLMGRVEGVLGANSKRKRSVVSRWAEWGAHAL